MKQEIVDQLPISTDRLGTNAWWIGLQITQLHAGTVLLHFLQITRFPEAFFEFLHCSRKVFPDDSAESWKLEHLYCVCKCKCETTVALT